MPNLKNVQVGESLPERIFEPSSVSLFLYNAAIWNPHRIHFDETYTTQVEKHPAIVVDGPLQGDWLSQVATEWIGDDGELVELEYSNRRAAYLGQRLRVSGEISAVDREAGLVTLTVQIINEAGDLLSPGTAVVRFRS